MRNTTVNKSKIPTPYLLSHALEMRPSHEKTQRILLSPFSLDSPLPRCPEAWYLHRCRGEERVIPSPNTNKSTDHTRNKDVAPHMTRRRPLFCGLLGFAHDVQQRHARDKPGHPSREELEEQAVHFLRPGLRVNHIMFTILSNEHTTSNQWRTKANRSLKHKRRGKRRGKSDRMA